MAMWEEDHSAVKAYLEQLVASGMEDVVGFLREHPAEYDRCVELARVLDVNRAAVSLFEASSRDELLARAADLYPPGMVVGLPFFWAAMLAGERSASYEEANLTLAGRELRILETCIVAPGHEETFDRVYIADVDVSGAPPGGGAARCAIGCCATEARDVMLVRADAPTRAGSSEANAAAEAAYGYSREELLQTARSPTFGRRRGGARCSTEQIEKAAAAGGRPL